MENLTPDFLIKKSDESFLVEATTLNSPDWMSKTSNRRDALIEYINNNVSSDHFHLSIDFVDEPMNPKSSEISEFLKKNLEEESRNYEFLKDQRSKGDFKIITYSNKKNNSRIEFELIPKSPPKSSERVIVVNGIVGGWMNTNDRLRDSLERKIKKYKHLNQKLILAVNCLERVDDIDMKQALYGDEVIAVRSDCSKTIFSRKNNGLWVSHWDNRTFKNDANVCIMFFDKVCIDNYGEMEPKIIYHPTVQPIF